MSKKLAEQQTEWDLHDKKEDFVPLEFTEEIKPDLFGIEITKAREMVSGLNVTIAERAVLVDAYMDVIELPINSETLPIFKELRLKIVKNRTQGVEKWHKTNKAFYLAGGRFVDAIKNKEVLINEQMEFKLLQAEKHFENLEKEAKKLLNLERIERIKPYIEHADALDFTEMNDYDFDDFVLGKKTRFENETKQREADALKIEAERLAELVRQNAIEAENKILKAKIEAERIEAERLAKIEADKMAIQQAKQNEILQKERAEKAKIEAELKAKIEAEQKAEAQLKANAEAERIEAELKAKAPIKEQLNVWVESFELPNRTILNEQSDDILLKFEDFKKWAKNKINTI